MYRKVYILCIHINEEQDRLSNEFKNKGDNLDNAQLNINETEDISLQMIVNLCLVEDQDSKNNINNNINTNSNINISSNSNIVTIALFVRLSKR